MIASSDPLALENRVRLPDALRVLTDEIPRESWEQHPHFGELVQFWLQRHMMFRQLSDVLIEDVQALLDGELSPAQHAPRLQHYGGLFLQELHTHHHVEDNHYFPHLIKLDCRVEAGFQLLDKDHHAMDGLLAKFAAHANKLLREGPDAAGSFLAQLEHFVPLLERHLTDEEEIVVPVILASGFSG